VCAPPVFYEINHLSFDACNEFKENRRYVILEIGVVEGLRGRDRKMERDQQQKDGGGGNDDDCEDYSQCFRRRKSPEQYF